MECARVFPVLKTSGMVIWASSTGNDQTDENQTKNNNDFDRGEPEFKLSEESDAEVVDSYNGYQEDCDEYSGVDLRARYPVLEHKGGSSKVVGCNNNVLLNLLVIFYFGLRRKGFEIVLGGAITA
jgi:hypothetical protein